MSTPFKCALLFSLVSAAVAADAARECAGDAECLAAQEQDGEDQALKVSLLQRPRVGEAALLQANESEDGSWRAGCHQYRCQSSFQSWKKCQCNNQCEKFNNCCFDYFDLCLPSCKRLGCKARYHPTRVCQCNSACESFGNCCKDYESECMAPPTEAPTEAPTEPTEAPTPEPTAEPTPPTPVPTPFPTWPKPAVAEVPELRDPAKRYVMKGMAWGPAPETERGVMFERDDFLSEAGAPLFMPWGRGDFATIKALGANTIRLYGMDPTQSHKMGLDEADRNGLGLIIGVSDWPYLQMPGNCQETNGNCYQQIFEWYTAVLDTGLTVKKGAYNAYHHALKGLIVINEPEIGKFNQDRTVQCKVVVSAIDAILEAEEVKGVYGNPLTFTVPYSMAGFYGGPAFGQMQMLKSCMMDIGRKAGGYKPKNDVKKAYLDRFANSFNTHNNAGTVEALVLKPYKREFWSHGVKIPLMIGEYHASSEGQKYDLPAMLHRTMDPRYPFFLGYNFFEFQARYDKLQNWEHEMTFGMFGFDFDCDMGNLSWWGGGEFFGVGYYNGKNYTVHNLVPRKDPRGYSKAKALAEAYGGDDSNIDYSCKKIKQPKDFLCHMCWR